MTVLDWLKASTRYSGFTEQTYETIALDREINGADDVTTLSAETKELLKADIIFNAVMFSPSSTSSHTVMHNGFQESIGAETDLYQGKKIDYAMMVYKKYGDPKYDLLNGTTSNIKFIQIEDII